MATILEQTVADMHEVNSYHAIVVMGDFALLVPHPG